MENLYIYEKTRCVPESAQKTIKAGRLKGMTDINPMWRIKVLTETFGVCGIGWKTQIVRTWLDEGANGEVTANVEILLFVKVDGAWSDGIPGVGGSRLVAKENSGLYTDDECYKKAYTDAISVACKALGVGADVYWDKDSTKYDSGNGDGNTTAKPQNPPQNAPKEKPLTYEEALEFKLADGFYAGHTLRDVWKSDATFIKQLSENPATHPRLLEAIRVINAEIRRANDRK